MVGSLPLAIDALRTRILEGNGEMERVPLDDVVRNIDRRLTRVEQILPTLTTKTELANAVAQLATKAELAAAIAPLATKVELTEAVREEGERTRRYFDVVAERLEGHIQLLAEGQVALRERMDEQFAGVRGDIGQLDRRVTRLEAGRRA